MLNVSLVNLVLVTHLLEGLTLVQLLDRGLQILQSQYQDGDVVQRPAGRGFSQADLDTLCCSNVLVVIELLGSRATKLFIYPQVICLRWQIVVRFARCLLRDAVPHSLNNLLVVHPLKDAVTSNEEEVKVGFQFEALYLGFADDYVRVSAILRTLCLDVAESSGYREAAGEYSQWSLNIQVFLIRGGSGFSERLSSVDLASCGLDSYTFLIVVRLVISGKNCDLRASIKWHDTPTITNIDNIGHIVNNHYYCCTWSRSLRSYLLTWHRMLCPRLSNFDKIKEAALTLLEPCNDSLLRELREVFILYYKVV